MKKITVLSLITILSILLYNCNVPITNEATKSSCPDVPPKKSFNFFVGIAFNNTGEGYITSQSTPNGVYEAETLITVDATTDRGSFFAGWFDATSDGRLVSRKPYFQSKLKSDTKLYARFTKSKYSFNVYLSPGSANLGSINRSITTNNGNYFEGTSITVSAKSNSTSDFSGWYDSADNGKLISTKIQYTFTLKKNIILYAKFTPKQYNFGAYIANNSVGLGNLVKVNTTTNGIYSHGITITVEAQNINDNQFLGWFDSQTGGTLLSSEKRYSFSLTKSSTIYAHFKRAYYFASALAVDGNGLGRINPVATTRNGYYEPNTMITVKAIAGKDSFFFGWYDSPDYGHCISRDLTYRFNLNKTTRIYARFDLVNINFDDRGFEQAVRNRLNKPTGQITYYDVRDIDQIYHYGNATGNIKISRITGIEYFISLNKLQLPANRVEDISQLKNLVRLMTVDLTGYWLTDITGLVENPGISSGDVISLYASKIPKHQLDALSRRGVRLVTY